MTTSTKDKISATLELISKANKIVITTHVSPDGDAIGSTLGLYHFLKGFDKNVTVITPNAFPDFLKWMKDSDKIVPFTENEALAKELTANADLMFCLDFNDLSRLDKYSETALACTAPKVMIDHHEQPKDFALVMFSDIKKSSTCEMVYDFIAGSGREDLVTPELAACLYTGLNTDTGSFRFSCTRPDTHRAAARLIEWGADNAKIAQLLNDTNTFDRLQLMGYTLSNKLVYLPEYHAIYSSLTLEEMQRYNYRDGDTEGLVNFGLSVGAVKMSVFFKEADGKIKISFRSKNGFSVQQIAKKYFNGGGHFNASGGASYVSLEETIQQFLAILPEYQEELKNA